jgi:cysteine sulfinate desulfinase/cysteine desulfurase-like protein
MGAIRFSLGIDTTRGEIAWVVDRLKAVLGDAHEDCATTEEEIEFALDYSI